MIKKWFVILFSSLFSVFLWYWIIYAWVWLTASPWDQLTSSKWNELVNKVANVYSTWANVWIWTITPYTSLHVTRDVTDTDLNSWYWQMIVSWLTNTFKRLIMWYNTTSNYAFLQWNTYWATRDNLILQPKWANVWIWTTTPWYNLEVSWSTSLASTNGTVYIWTQNNENEWAEIRLKWAWTNDSWVQDVYAQWLRFYTNTANTNTVSIFNNSTWVANLSVEWTATAATPTASNHLATKAYVDAAVSAAGGWGKSKSETFTSWAGTWTVPTWVTWVEVILVWAGWWWGGCSNSSTTYWTSWTNWWSTTFWSLTAYWWSGWWGGSTYYSNSSWAWWKWGWSLGAWWAWDSYSWCDWVDTTPSKFSATIFWWWWWWWECAWWWISLFTWHSTWHRWWWSYSSIYWAWWNRWWSCWWWWWWWEVVRLTIPVSWSVAYSIWAWWTAWTWNSWNWTNWYWWYIQINYVE